MVYHCSTFLHRLKDCLNSKLVDDFVTALEQLNSPELAMEGYVRDRAPATYGTDTEQKE